MVSNTRNGSVVKRRESDLNSANNTLGSVLLNSYSDTPYNSIALTNPYAKQLANYKRGFIDVLGDSFGFASREDTLRNSALEFDSQIGQIKFENEYNSESSRASRMREAGENPDLLGTSGVSDSSGFDMTQTSPDQNAGFDVVSSFASTMMTVVGMSFDVASKFINIEDMVSSLDAKDISNASSALGIADHLQRVFLGTGSNIRTIQFDRKSRSFGSLDDEGRFLPFMSIPVNNRNFKRISNYLKANGYDVKIHNDYFSGLRGSHEERDKYIRSSSSRYSSPYILGDNEHVNERALRAIVEPLTKLTDDLLNENLNSNISDSSYNRQYKSDLDPHIAASAENRVNTERGSSADQKSKVMSTFREIISNLESTAHDPKASKFDRAVSNAALLVIPAVIAKLGM